MKNFRKKTWILFLFLATMGFAQLTPEQQKIVEEAEKRAAKAQKMQDSLMKTPEMKKIMEQIEAVETENEKEREQLEARDRNVRQRTGETNSEDWFAELSIDDQGYSYGQIQREKSRVFYDEGVWIELRQGNRPDIIYSFPTIERYSAIGRHDFILPDFNKVDGRQPMTFYVVREQDTLMFKGAITASLNSGIVKVQFQGDGSKKGMPEKPVPLSGNFKVTIN